MTLQSRLRAIQPIIIVVLLAAFLRAWAVSLLPQDFDEPVYLQVGFDYAHDIQMGNFNAVIDDPNVTEHPAFVKLLYSSVVLAMGKAATWTNAFYASRAVSAVFGVLAVAFIAIALDPLAAGMLAVHTLAVKYTSQVYLEAVPSAMTIGAVLAFLRVDREKIGRWFWLSAIALGVATASKYSYIPVILVVLGYLAVFEKKIRWNWLLAYGTLAVGTFLLLDVSLWHDPVNRLIQSLFFHVQYSQGAHVQEVAYPWYQPFIWIFTSAASSWHPAVFFYYGFDGIIAVLAVLGLVREYRERRWLLVWLIFGVIFLLLWPTKWPQYALSVVPALCIMGAESLRRGWRWVRDQEAYWEYFRNLIPTPGKWLWYGLGAFAVFIAALYLSAAIRLAVGRVGWSSLTAQNSFLPGNAVHDLLPLENGQMLIATDKGAALWSPSQATDGSGQWVVFDQADSGLIDDQVLSLALDSTGDIWFGTASGLSEYSRGDQWVSYGTGSLPLANDEIISLAADDQGRVFAGSLSGAAVWDGSAWTVLPIVQGKTIFSLTSVENAVWIGTADGAGRYDLSDGSWIFYPTGDAVRDILVDSSGTVWVSTSGTGLGRLVGDTWQYYTTEDGNLPSNNINDTAEVEPGLFWIATAMSTNAGGTPVSFDGKSWHSYTTDNSGASGSEPLVIVAGTDRRVWIGTATRGIDIYKLGR